ncbi:hypothetical protein AB0K80_14995 [Streptomyces sp. NPDC052682]|uniref:hypothetical protein n=1 Tax=Streptomyces sp. NPDC052682 TaxID=3154954 RepID=UPI00343C4234
MTDLIRRLLTRAAVLLKGPRTTSAPLQDQLDLPLWPATPPLPAHRSPYTHDDTPLDAAAVRSVRPYLTTPWIHGLEAA